MRVRLATASDRDVVLELIDKLLVELGSRPLQFAEIIPVFNDLIRHEDAGFVVICEMGNKVEAVCTVSFLQALRSHGRYAIIQEMYVVPEKRGSGIGSSALRFALAHAASSGCRFVELGTPKAGQRQIHFYERGGFVQVGARLRWTPTAS